MTALPSDYIEKAMELAKEMSACFVACENYEGDPSKPYQQLYADWKAAEANLRAHLSSAAQPVPQGEPVAWLLPSGKVTSVKIYAERAKGWTPLYASPPPSAVLRQAPTNIAMLGAQRNDLAALVEAIKDALYSKPGQPVNFTEALGALELVKLELYEEMRRQ